MIKKYDLTVEPNSLSFTSRLKLNLPLIFESAVEHRHCTCAHQKQQQPSRVVVFFFNKQTNKQKQTTGVEASVKEVSNPSQARARELSTERS